MNPTLPFILFLKVVSRVDCILKIGSVVNCEAVISVDYDTGAIFLALDDQAPVKVVEGYSVTHQVKIEAGAAPILGEVHASAKSYHSILRLVHHHVFDRQ